MSLKKTPHQLFAEQLRGPIREAERWQKTIEKEMEDLDRDEDMMELVKRFDELFDALVEEDE